MLNNTQGYSNFEAVELKFVSHQNNEKNKMYFRSKMLDRHIDICIPVNIQVPEKGTRNWHKIFQTLRYLNYSKIRTI